MRNKEPDFSVGLQIFCNSERGVEKGRGVGWCWEMGFASLYPQTKVGDILDSGPSRRRRRRRRNFLVDAITQKQINIFFSNLVHMLRVPKGRSLF